MDFIKRHASILFTLVFFIALPMFHLDNIFLSLLVFLFLYPFTKRRFIAKALFFISVLYFMLLSGIVLLSLLAGGILADPLYVGLVLTVWSWLSFFTLSGIIDDDEPSSKGRMFYFIVLVATPFACSAISGMLDEGLRTILYWVVGLSTLSSLIALFQLFGLIKGDEGGSGRKTASIFVVENAARSAARSCHCDVSRVYKDGGCIVVVLENARDSYGWSNVAKNVMEEMSQKLSGYDVGNIKIVY